MGPGFDEKPPRLSLGFARVGGDPPNLRAEDFATDADTIPGGGSSAIKASGLLLGDGTLYMWVRNYRPPGSDDFTNARLGCSKNGGTNLREDYLHLLDFLDTPGTYVYTLVYNVAPEPPSILIEPVGATKRHPARPALSRVDCSVRLSRITGLLLPFLWPRRHQIVFCCVRFCGTDKLNGR